MKNLITDPDYDDIKIELIKEMWKWCVKTDDILFDPYPTSALIPYGPLIYLNELKDKLRKD